MARGRRLPGFFLKFGIRGHLEEVLAADTKLEELGGAKAVPTLTDKDLLEVCLARGIGHPAWTRAQLEAGARTWLSETASAPSLVPKDASPDMAICPFRSLRFPL